MRLFFFSNNIGFLIRKYLLTGLIGFSFFICRGQTYPSAILFNHELDNKLIEDKYYLVLEDKLNNLTFADALLADSLAVPGLLNIRDVNATYWVTFTIEPTSFSKANNFHIEFIDPHISEIELAIFKKGKLVAITPVAGSDHPFSQKIYRFKNFLYPVVEDKAQPLQFVVRIKSNYRTTFLFKLRTEVGFISQSKNEYYGLGIFYGAILITIITNFIIFLFIRERIYLYYSLYLTSCGLLFLSEDMLGFEYLWPSYPFINHYINHYSPILLILSFYFYARDFIQIRNYYPKANFYIKLLMLGCVCYLLANAWFTFETPDYKFYIVPFFTLYIFAIFIARKGSKTARYFIVAHSFIIIGIAFLILRKSGISFLANPLTFFSLHIGFAIELAVLSYALGEQLSHTKTLKIKAQEKLLLQLKTRQRAQHDLVMQLQENQVLKDKLNQELEQEVRKRAAEIVEANDKLKQQAEQISKMNQLLDLDNWALKKDIRKITQERVLSKEVGFEEFSKLYPDHLACLRFLAEKKWDDGFVCKKCTHKHYCEGKTPLARRCTRCRYEESPTAFTLLHKCKIPLDKAFYAIFLIYNRKGEISSVELSNQLNLRQSTCWSFLQKIKQAMSIHKKRPRGWDAIILDPTPQLSAEALKSL
jgi:two-component system, sensor histidine kinase LadS